MDDRLLRKIILHEIKEILGEGDVIDMFSRQARKTPEAEREIKKQLKTSVLEEVENFVDEELCNALIEEHMQHRQAQMGGTPGQDLEDKEKVKSGENRRLMENWMEMRYVQARKKVCPTDPPEKPRSGREFEQDLYKLFK